MSIRELEQMQRDGFVIFPFPAQLAHMMKAHIAQFVGLQSAASSEQKFTQAVQKWSDQEFTKRFAKPLRMFPDAVGHHAVQWVESLAVQLGGKQSSVNYVSRHEREQNPTLTKGSYDVFWRCVRPGKPDVGAAHCDYQFWELAKGTPLDVETPLEYDERWKIWIPLVGCDATNSLEVVPGSHNEDVPIDKVLTPNGYKPVIQSHWLEKHSQQFQCPLRSFQDVCILFHDKLVHRGPPNHASSLRLSGELTIVLKL